MKLASLFAAPVALLLMAARPGGVPTTVYLPGAALTSRTVAYDGGFTGLPPVLIKNVAAPVFFEFNAQGTGIVPAMSGYDGGAVPGVMFEETGYLTSATSPAFSVLWRNFSGAPVCTCTIASGASSINVCTSQLDAGIVPQYQLDAGPVTTVVIGTLAADGGTWSYDCKGY